jgi:gas vesicle protein
MANRLKQLIVDRVDLVDAGANPDADVVLFKREEPTAVEKATFGEIQQTRETEEMIHDLYVMCMDLESAIFSSLYASGDRVAEVKTSIQQFGDAVAGLMDEMVKENPVAKHRREDVIAKLKAFAAPYIKEVKVEEVQKTDETPPVVEDVEKSIPEEFRKRLEDAERVAKEATDRIAKAEETAAIEKAKREHVELVKRAQDELPNLPGTPDEKADILKLADTSTPLMTALKAGNEAMQKAMTEVGTPAGAAPVTAAQEIEKRADALIAADPKLTRAIAIEKALQADPVLYTKYREERTAK